MDVEDNNAFCEKIINAIYAVFTKDPELIGFEIIPMPSNQNKSPIVHVDHHLGLQSWCIKYIYEYSHRVIIKHKLENLKSPTSSFLLSHNTTSSNTIVKYLNCAILINPDALTFWNVRRQLFVKNKLDITKEFQFSAIVLSKKPKSNEAFAYRRWLYSFRSHESIDWAFEIGLCEKCADKSTANYHSWCHRQWILQKATHLLKFEIHKTEKFIRKHIHDYSCYNHRQFVLSKMHENCYFDEDEKNYKEIFDYVRLLTKNNTIESIDDLMGVLVPTAVRENANEMKMKSFLYCINLAVSDMKLCEELKFMYGDFQAFELHRRFMIKFLFDSCRCALDMQECKGSKSECLNMSSCNQPMTKITKYDMNDDSSFLKMLVEYECNRGNYQHQKWCQIFLDLN